MSSDNLIVDTLNFVAENSVLVFAGRTMWKAW